MLDFLGDVFLDGVYDIDVSLGDFIFNLEFPMSKSGRPALNKVNLGTETSYILDSFKKAPVAVNLANNHIYDFGEEGLRETLKVLDELGIEYFGIDCGGSTSPNSFIYNSNGNSIANLAYVCQSTNPVDGDNIKLNLFDLEKVISDVVTLKQINTVVVVHIHWGDEEIKYPKPADVVKAKRIIEAGADMIIGHHAHIIQSVITHLGKPIYFGLGNFLFPDLDVPAYHDGKIFQGRYCKKQKKHNKRSLIVSINENLSVSHKFVVFDGRKVSPSKGNVSSKLLDDKRYKKYWDNYIRRVKIQRYLSNPKLPSISQLKRFISG